MDAQTRANQLIEKANAFYAQGRGVAAAPLYREAAQLFPPYASFHLVAGDILLKYEQWEEAAEAYRAVLAEHPGHDQARLALHECHRHLGRPTRRGFGRFFTRR